MMPYWVRITIGVVLGVLAAVLLWLFVGITWVTALVAALLAPIGFLGSYFIWSADRLPEYEQVLFDRPNTIVSLVLIVGFALAGVGTGFLGGSDAPPTPADELYAMRAEYQGISDSIVAKSLEGDAAIAAINDLRAKADPLGVTIEALPADEDKDALVDAYDYLTTAMTQLKDCAKGDSGKCLEARISNSEVQTALERYSELAA